MTVEMTDIAKIANGEIPDGAPSYPDALKLVARYRRILDGQQLRIADLEAEREQRMGQEAGAQDIRAVLEECKRVLELRIKIVPGSEGWRKVKARLKDFDVTDLKAVPHGAKKSDWYRAARHRLQPKFLFRSHDSVEELVELGLGVVTPTVTPNVTLTREHKRLLAGLRPWELDVLERCDCGHLRCRHAKNMAEGPMANWWPCLDCGCTDFDDIHQRADRWLAQQRSTVKRGFSISEPAEASLALDGGSA